MKTLTLFRAYKKATRKRSWVRRDMANSTDLNSWLFAKDEYYRMSSLQEKLSGRIVKHLQEQDEELEFLYTEVSTYQGLALSAEEHISRQDEELEMLRNYAGETTVLLNAHGWDLEEWFKKYEKEKTNE